MELGLCKSIPNNRDRYSSHSSLFLVKKHVLFIFLAIVLIIVNKEIELINDQH